MANPKRIEWVKDGDCMICTSHACSGSGYPRAYRNGKAMNISRMILFRHYGEQPSDKVCRHTCDRRDCINPSHIIIGTMGDNNRDTVARGRHPASGFIRKFSGKTKPWAKLTESQVIEIRVLCETSMPLRKIGKCYGIGLDATRKIKLGRSWKHLLPT